MIFSWCITSSLQLDGELGVRIHDGYFGKCRKKIKIGSIDFVGDY